MSREFNPCCAPVHPQQADYFDHNTSLQAAVSFRDAALFAVFQLALAALRQLAVPGQQPDPKLQEQVTPPWTR